MLTKPAVICPCFPGIERPRLEAALQLATRGVNAPWTSSLGRLFDAVAALLSVRLQVDYDGQAAAELEVAATVEAEGFAMPMIINQGLFELDLAPLVQGLLAGIAGGRSSAELAAAFHQTVADGLAAAVQAAHASSGLTRVVLSGGCMMNRRLDRLLEQALTRRGLEVFAHQQVPANDGGLCLGQAAVAAARCRA